MHHLHCPCSALHIATHIATRETKRSGLNATSDVSLGKIDLWLRQILALYSYFKINTLLTQHTTCRIVASIKLFLRWHGTLAGSHRYAGVWCGSVDRIENDSTFNATSRYPFLVADIETLLIGRCLGPNHSVSNPFEKMPRPAAALARYPCRVRLEGRSSLLRKLSV